MTSSTILALALFVFAGALGGPQGSAQLSVRDRFSPSNVRTQVFTLSTSIKTTFAAIGAALAGVISGASPALLLLIAVSANVLGGLIAIFDLKAGGWMKSPVSRDVGISEVQPPSRIRDARGSD
jgi:homoserine kinase